MSWEERTWEDIVVIKNGKNQKKVINPKGRYPIYGSGGVIGYADDFICEAGSTIIGRKGSINNPIFVDEKYWNVDTAFGLHPKKGLDNKFFYYFCTTYDFLKHNKTVTIPSLTKSDLLKIKIPLPPLEQQKKIAAILDAADAYRQKTKALITKYDELTQSLFLDMFGDPVKNEKGWEVRKLSDFIKNLNTGVSVNSTDKPYGLGDIGILKTSCVYTGIFRPQEAKIIRDDEFPRMKLNPKADSIIISRMNTPELVGKSVYISKDFNNLFLPDRLWQTEPGPLKHNVRWLSFALSFQSFMQEVGKVSSGTSGSMKNISMKKYLNLDMIIPSLNLQNQFAERVLAIETQKEQAQASLEKAEELFNSLVQRAFKGELV
jgi:type I restriction enzyme S subunit